MVNAAIGGWYYLRIITVMYLRTAVKPIETGGTLAGLLTLIACVVVTLGLSAGPGTDWVRNAAMQTTVRNNPGH